jgi:hypothetical protein
MQMDGEVNPEITYGQKDESGHNVIRDSFMIYRPSF